MKFVTTWRAMQMAAVLVVLTMAADARAGLVNWDVDPAQSYIRLAIPDQAFNIQTDLGLISVTVRLRDANSAAWSDAGGRRAFLDGTVATDLNDGASVEFLSGSHNLFALEQTSLRPNPADFTGPPDANNPDGTYAGTSTALTAFGAKVRGTYILTFDAAYLAIRDVFADIASGVVPLAGGTTIAGGSTNFGIASAIIDADGLALPLGLGQPVPDILNEPVGLGTLLNVSGGTITNEGGLLRKLTYSVNVPINITVDTITVVGSATGQVVAYALVPEPSTVLLAGFAAIGLVVAGRRRFIRR